MATLPGTAPCAEAPASPGRHGKCRLTLTIGGTSYAVRPVTGQPRGMKVFALRSLTGERAGKVYSVALINREAGCTCPDAEVNGATCKHVMALRAIGFLPVSARTASESKAEEARLAATRRRRACAPPAAPVDTPADKPDPLARARRRHSPATIAPLAPPASPFASGWNAAVSKHVAALKGGPA